MAEKPTYMLYLILAMCLLGLCCCVILGLRMLRQMRADGKSQRLLRRQLLSLAVAGFVEYACGLWVPLIDLAVLPPVIGKDMCVGSYTLFRTFRTIVIFQQTQLAVAFFAQCVKWTSLLPYLYRYVWLVWIAGGAIGLANTLLVGATHDTEYGTCDLNKDKRDIGDITVLLLSLLICLVSCIATMICSLRLPFKVARANYGRATWYPLVSIITYTAPMAAYFFPQLRQDQASLFWPTVMLVESSNLPLSVGVFLVQAQCARRERLASRRGEEPLTIENGGSTCSGVRDLVNFHVNFGGVQVVDICVCDGEDDLRGTVEVADARGPSAGDAPSRFGSFHSNGSSQSSREKLRVKVVGYAKVPTMPSAFTVAVAKGSTKYTVYRRCEEFGELERALKKRVPRGTLVPAAPKDRCYDAALECVDVEGFQQRRRSAAEDFLRGCLALQEELGAFRELQAFLGDRSFQGALQGLQRQRSGSNSAITP